MSKKENLQEPEELQNVENALSSSEEFIENHLKEIIYAVIAIVAVFVGFFLFKYKYLQPRELKAQEQIYKGEEYFAQDSFALAINGDGVDFIGFENIAKEYKWTKTAKLAICGFLRVFVLRLGAVKFRLYRNDRLKANAR